jgi:hypothetical protein
MVRFLMLSFLLIPLIHAKPAWAEWTKPQAAHVDKDDTATIAMLEGDPAKVVVTNTGNSDCIVNVTNKPGIRLRQKQTAEVYIGHANVSVFGGQLGCDFSVQFAE